jgi:hypothetical protein
MSRDQVDSVIADNIRQGVIFRGDTSISAIKSSRGESVYFYRWAFDGAPYTSVVSPSFSNMRLRDGAMFFKNEPDTLMGVTFAFPLSLNLPDSLRITHQQEPELLKHLNTYGKNNYPGEVIDTLLKNNMRGTLFLTKGKIFGYGSVSEEERAVAAYFMLRPKTR